MSFGDWPDRDTPPAADAPDPLDEIFHTGPAELDEDAPDPLDEIFHPGPARPAPSVRDVPEPVRTAGATAAPEARGGRLAGIKSRVKIPSKIRRVPKARVKRPNLSMPKLDGPALEDAFGHIIWLIGGTLVYLSVVGLAHASPAVGMVVAVSTVSMIVMALNVSGLRRAMVVAAIAVAASVAGAFFWWVPVLAFIVLSSLNVIGGDRK